MYGYAIISRQDAARARSGQVLGLALGLCLAAMPVVGAAVPSAPVGEFQQRLDQDASPAAGDQPPREARSAATATPDEKRVLVKGFHLSGVTRLDAQTLSEKLAAHANRPLSARELQQAANLVAEAYLHAGLLARVRVTAVGPDGIAQVQVTELKQGHFALDIPQGSRVTPGLAGKFLGVVPADGEALALHRLEAAVTLLNVQPGIAAAMTVDPGRQADEADVTLRLRDRPLLSGQLSADNHGLREIGQGRLGANLVMEDAFGQAERGAIRLEKTSDSSSVYPSFSVPVGYDGTRAGVSYSHADYRSDRVGAAMELKGQFQFLRVYARRPLLRDKDLSLYADLDWQQTRWHDDSIFGELHRRVVTGMAVNLSGQHRGPASQERFGLEVLGGRADLSANADDLTQDLNSSRIQGQFLRVTWRLSQTRPLAGGELLLKAQGQWSDSNLDASQKFSLGGPDRVRAYPTEEALGDQGYVASAEWRHAMGPALDGHVFLDSGWIRLNDSPWDTARNSYALSGGGLGVIQRLPANSRFALDAAWQIGKNPYAASDGSASDGRRDRWRVWASLQHNF